MNEFAEIQHRDGSTTEIEQDQNGDYHVYDVMADGSEEERGTYGGGPGGSHDLERVFVMFSRPDDPELANIPLDENDQDPGPPLDLIDPPADDPPDVPDPGDDPPDLPDPSADPPDPSDPGDDPSDDGGADEGGLIFNWKKILQLMTDQDRRDFKRRAAKAFRLKYPGL